jgi:4-oxalocrotonate tautomerase family enzyme
MAQIKIYGSRAHLDAVKAELSNAIHACTVEALGLPADKRFHRFFPLDAGDFYYPAGRTERYTIIEISMFEGRSVEAKKQLITVLIERISTKFELDVQDIEITIFETPKHNWGIRGQPADELALGYKVEV